MNWTGGQLYCHSTRRGLLSKTQRQNFAKSRQLATKPSPPRPFTGVPGLKVDASLDQKIPDQPPFNTDHQLEMSTDDNSSHLDCLKKRLLQKPDWAVLSVVRPLEVSFVSAEETERFGKRRKLTDTDRERLTAVYGDRTLPIQFHSHQKNRGLSAEVGRQNIKISINGRLAGQQPGELQGSLSRHQPSSQSMMLLENDMVDLSSRWPIENLLHLRGSEFPVDRHQAWHDRVHPPPEIRPSESGSRRIEDSDSFDPEPSLAPTPVSRIANPTWSTRHVFECSTLPATERRLGAELSPRVRHSTIDDQTLAEKLTGSFQHHDSDFLGPTPAVSPILITSSSGEASSWLPQRQRLTQPSSPLAYRSNVTLFQDIVKQESPSVISDRAIQDHSVPSPIKFYGQHVDSRDSIERA